MGMKTGRSLEGDVGSVEGFEPSHMMARCCKGKPLRERVLGNETTMCFGCLGPGVSRSMMG
jgi:hypothetical protein